MKKLNHWIKEHRKVSLIALAVFLLFVSGSAMSAINVANRRAEVAGEQSSANENSTATAAQEKTKQEAEDVELTSEQKSLIKDYDDETKDFIKTLSASVWSAKDGLYSLKFSDDVYVETANGMATSHGYAISRLETGTDQQGITYYNVVFLTDTGTHIVTYTETRGESQDGSISTTASLTSSSMFELSNTEYERAEAVESITIKGMNSEVKGFFGSDESNLVSALSEWCAVHYPSVTEATWDKTVDIDYDKGTVVTSFSLNDADNSSAYVMVTYTTDTGEFSFN